MSEQAPVGVETATEDPEGFEPEDFRAKDFYLDTLMTFIVGSDNLDPDSSIGITLTVGGNVVTGDLISYGAWGESIVDTLTEASTAIGEAFGKVHHGVIKADQERNSRRDRLRLAIPNRRYIHMKNVQLNPGDVNTVKLALWRGVLDDVDGWSLGRLGK